MYEGPVVYESNVIDYFLLSVSVSLVIICIVLYLIALSKIFDKAGKKKWAAFVPFYNNLVLLEVANLSKIYFILLFIPIIQLFAIYKINQELGKAFKKSSRFTLGLIFLPFIFYPILAFSKDKYIGINDEEVEQVVLRDLIKEQVDTTQPSTILKTDENINIGTNAFNTPTNIENGQLQTDMSFLEQKKPTVIEYIDCPVCKNKVKKGMPVCFICGHKF